MSLKNILKTHSVNYNWKWEQIYFHHLNLPYLFLNFIELNLVFLSYRIIQSQISIIWLTLIVKFYNECKIISEIKKNYLSITFIALLSFILINNLNMSFNFYIVVT